MSDTRPDVPGRPAAAAATSEPIRVDEDLAAFTSDIADQVESFVYAVTEVARGHSPEVAISQLLLQVSQLTLAGGRLGAIRDVVPDERFEPDTGPDPDADDLRAALAELLAPIDEYTEIFDPYGEPELVQQRLSDDIAGITSDLVHGLQHFKAGRSAEALWWWQFSYLSSWGATAGSSLRALQSVVSHVRLDGLIDDEVEAEDRLLAETAVAAVQGTESPLDIGPSRQE